MTSYLPVGRLAEHLESLSRERVWFAIVAAAAAIASLNHAVLAIGIAPLYMPVICGACWGLDAREGYFVAIGTELLAVVPSLFSVPSLAPDIHIRLSAVLAQSPYPVTCSIGALLIPPDAPRSPGELTHAADQAMYSARQTGKNAVEIRWPGELQSVENVGVRGQRRVVIA
jgi:GGDEF domain-containing protein